MTIKILFLCLLIGAVCGLVDGVISTLLRSRHIVFTVINDIVLAAALVGSHAFVSYLYCDGLFFLYAICAQIVGFIILRIVASKVTNKAVAALSPKIMKLKEKRKARMAERKRKKRGAAQKAQ